MYIKSIFIYDKNINHDKNMSYLCFLTKFYLVLMGGWDFIHALHKYTYRVGMVCLSYDIIFKNVCFITNRNMDYTYDFLMSFN